MFIKVTRSAAITALLSGKTVFCGPANDRHWATGVELGKPSAYSRRRAAQVLTRFFYGDTFFPSYTKVGYWIYQ